MYAFLLFLSVVTMAVGFFAVGFGLSPYELSLGNALIMAGAVAIVGGMILFALAAALRQLRRIADALGGARPVAAAPARRPQAAEPATEPPPPRPAPPPSRPPYPARPDARSAPAAELPEPPVPERPRPNIFGVTRGNGDTADIEEPEAMPLAPSRPPAIPTALPAMRPPVAEPPVEPKATPADIMARLGNLATSPQRQLPPRPEPRAIEQRVPPPEPQGSNMFDALWPADARAARQSQPEAIARAPKPRPEPRPEPKLEMRPEPRPDPRQDPRPEPRQDARPEPRFEPPMARQRMEPPGPPPSMAPPRERIEPAAAPPAAESRPIAILKSGVIDGMAYTLYTDGSIEAELPQGTMRFGSIEELRSHLEKAERQD